MILSGFADEAAEDLAGQIQVTKSLGWSHIEARTIDEKNIIDLTEEEFSSARGMLEKEGIRINCLGSTIANWGTGLDEALEETLTRVDRAVRRMKILEIPHIRIMSYKILTGPDGRALDQQEKTRFERMRIICGKFLDAGQIPVHENCHTYGGMSISHCERLLDAVPGLKLVFDTGNPPLTDDFSSPFPYVKQSAFEFYSRVREHIVHVHIKDAFYDSEAGKEVYTFPGEGKGDVVKIIRDLHSRGYDGAFSIEPHMAVVFHDTSVSSDKEFRRRNYIEYGHRCMKILKEAGCSVD